MSESTVDAEDLRRRVADFLAGHDPGSTDRLEFLRARFDAGLAWVNFPEELGGWPPEHVAPCSVDPCDGPCQ